MELFCVGKWTPERQHGTLHGNTGCYLQGIWKKRHTRNSQDHLAAILWRRMQTVCCFNNALTATKTRRYFQSAIYARKLHDNFDEPLTRTHDSHWRNQIKKVNTISHEHTTSSLPQHLTVPDPDSNAHKIQLNETLFKIHLQKTDNHNHTLSWKTPRSQVLSATDSTALPPVSPLAILQPTECSPWGVDCESTRKYSSTGKGPRSSGYPKWDGVWTAPHNAQMDQIQRMWKPQEDSAQGS